MNKVVLVTGGAQGIGKAIALELAKNHYDVVINYLTSNKAAALLEEEIKKNYDVRVMIIQADVSKEEEVDAMISLIEKNGVVLIFLLIMLLLIYPISFILRQQMSLERHWMSMS